MEPNEPTPNPPVEPPPPLPLGPVPQQQVGVPPPAPPVRDKAQARYELLITIAIFAVVMIVLGIILGIAKYWARRQHEPGEHSSLTLSSFREMYENGEISQEEYEQIREKMARKMKTEIGLKPNPPALNTDQDVGRDGPSTSTENST